VTDDTTGFAPGLYTYYAFAFDGFQGISAAVSTGVSVVTQPPGDANGDGKVDFTDLLILAQHYGQHNATTVEGDFNNDGVVNFEDLLILAQNYAPAAVKRRSRGVTN